MYQDLKKKFWWHGMKRDVAEYVAQVKAEPGGTFKYS